MPFHAAPVFELEDPYDFGHQRGDAAPQAWRYARVSLIFRAAGSNTRIRGDERIYQEQYEESLAGHTIPIVYDPRRPATVAANWNDWIHKRNLMNLLLVGGLIFGLMVGTCAVLTWFMYFAAESAVRRARENRARTA
jgi:hypothetical protein